MPEVPFVDLDGVVRRWDPQRDVRIEGEYGLAPGSLAAAAFSDADSLARAVTGAITDRAWRHEGAVRLAERHGAIAEDAIAEWSASAGEIDTGVLDLVRRVRRLLPVALLTNATSRLRSDLDELGLSGEFDEIVNSAELGVAKPDPRAFNAACSRFGVDARQALFVDDTPVNVHAAERLGMRAHLFGSAAGVASFLCDVGALPHE